jgi:hypothetical protein
MACLVAFFSAGADLFIGPGQFVELEIRQIFYIDHSVFGFVYRLDELIQFQVNGPGISVLCVLDEKHHQKGHDRCASINDQLPGVGKVEDWAGNGPDLESCGFGQLYMVLFRENNIRVAGESGEAGNPGTLLMTTDRVARRVQWYPTSREKRARCGAPDLLLPVQEARSLIFQLASASRLLLMNK